MEKVNPIQVQKFLKGIDYPASKDDVLATAKREGADENVMKMLEQLPDQRFQSPTAVSEAIGNLG